MNFEHLKKSKKIKAAVLSIVAVALIALTVWIAWGNTALELNTYTVSSTDLPKAFDGYRIAHVSDLHNTEIGDENETLLKMLRDAKPQIICITGDLIDSRRTDIDVAVRFAVEAVKIAPCYYVTGNHEARKSQTILDGFEKQLAQAGVTVLHGREIDVEYNGAEISLVGIDDPDYSRKYGGVELYAEDISSLLAADRFTVLLSHRPEWFNQYVMADVDLVLSGHTHGGQFRLPFIGGLLAPEQGLFPKYDSGLYTRENTNMIISRGIGNSAFPFRFNNRPEVILVELKSDAE